MNRERDSKGLLESVGESPEVRSLLALGAGDEIDYDFERGLSQHLGTISALPAPSGGAPGASAAKATASLSSKALLLLIGAPVAVAAVVAAVGLTAGLGKEPRLAEPLDEARAVTLVETPLDPMGGGFLLPREGSGAAERETGATRARLAHESAPSAPRVLQLFDQKDDVNGHPASHAETSVRVAQGDRSVSPSTAALVAGSVASSTPDPRDEEASEDAARKREAALVAARRLTDERLKREMAELVEAKRALADDPGRALLLARNGEREFSHGVFSEERQHILILALLGLGRLDEAKRTAAPYLERHPDSPFARRVRAALDAAIRSPR